jgi:hypothetical protein
MPIALTELVTPKKKLRHDKLDSCGRKMAFIPSAEFLAAFVEWRKSRIDVIPSKC